MSEGMKAEYKTVDLRTVKGWNYFERLVQRHGWRVNSYGFNTVQLFRTRKQGNVPEKGDLCT